MTITPTEDYRFIVRAWPVNNSLSPRDEIYADFITAVLRAWNKAKDRTWRTVLVVDRNNMCWSQFNMIWSLPDAFREATLTVKTGKP